MFVALTLLKCIGMFPRHTYRDSTEKSAIRRITRTYIGPICIDLLVFSVGFMALKWIFFILSLIYNNRVSYADDGVLDYFGSIFVNLIWVLSEMIIRLIFLVKHKAITRCCRIVFYLNEICQITDAETRLTKLDISKRLILITLTFVGLIVVCIRAEVDFLRSLVSVIILVSVMATINAIISISNNLSNIQSKIHNIFETNITELSHQGLLDLRHNLHRIINNKAFSIRPVLVQSTSATDKIFFDQLFIVDMQRFIVDMHLKLQMAVNSAVDTFMEGFGFIILMILFNCMVVVTFTSYLSAKTFFLGRINAGETLMHGFACICLTIILGNFPAQFNTAVSMMFKHPPISIILRLLH